MSNNDNSIEDEEKKELSRWVGQSNEIVRKSFYSNLAIQDIKLFRAIISKINYNDTLFNDFYVLNYDELDLAGVATRKSDRFKEVTKSLKKLASTYVKIVDKDNTPTEVGLISNKFKYPRRKSEILIEIDEDLKPYLLDLKKEYTKYQLKNIGNIKTVQQLKLYELLRSWTKKGKYETNLKNLRDYLEIKEGTYEKYGNFKQKILKTAIQVINDNTDLTIEIEEKRVSSHSVDTIIFYIDFKEEYKTIEFDITELIDKVFIDKSGIKYIVKSYIKNKKEEDSYSLELVNLETYEPVSLGQFLSKEELYKIIKGRIDILAEIRETKKNKRKIDSLLSDVTTKAKSTKKVQIPDKKVKEIFPVSESERQARIKKFKENLDKETT